MSLANLVLPQHDTKSFSSKLNSILQTLITQFACVLHNSIGIGSGQCFYDLFVGREKKRRGCDAVSALSLVLATQTKCHVEMFFWPAQKKVVATQIHFIKKIILDKYKLNGMDKCDQQHLKFYEYFNLNLCFNI